MHESTPVLTNKHSQMQRGRIYMHIIYTYIYNIAEPSGTETEKENTGSDGDRKTEIRMKRQGIDILDPRMETLFLLLCYWYGRCQLSDTGKAKQLTT